MSSLIKRFLLLAPLIIFSCQHPATSVDASQFVTIEGNTMGTYYRLQYEAPRQALDRRLFDQLFDDINQAVSTYDSTSVIRAFNRAPEGMFESTTFDPELLKIFEDNIAISQQLHELTQGSFDPTVMPLVNFWGFGFTERNSTSRKLPAELLTMTGWDKVLLGNEIGKADAGTQLDLSGVAKGYAVDQAGILLERNQIKNYLIDIGGEMRARGLNSSGKPWTIGISRPAESAALNEFVVKLHLANRSLATSGNYRNFHVLDDGQKVSHTINPKTGYPERTSLLSVTIVSSDCAWADGLATAGMVMGLPAALDLIEDLDGVEGFFIYADEQGVFQYEMTVGFHQLLIK